MMRALRTADAVSAIHVALAMLVADEAAGGDQIGRAHV